MLYGIMGTVYGLCLFILPVWMYRRGIKDGLSLSQGKQPEPLKTPVQAFKQARQAKVIKQEQDKLMQGLQNILSYDGTEQKAGDG